VLISCLDGMFEFDDLAVASILRFLVSWITEGLKSWVYVEGRSQRSDPTW
jgi:hypothetical protein